MKFSKEARIGLLVSISLLILFAGFYFLKGANLFSGENQYYAYYDNVQGLQPSSAVQVKGLSVGRVAKIELNGNDRVKVTIAVSNDIKVTKGSVAKIASADLLGSKVLSLELAQGAPEVEEGAELAGAIEGGIIDNISVEITPLIRDIRHMVTVLDTVLVGVNTMLGPDTRTRLEHSVANLDVTMQNFSQLSAKLNRESEELASIIRNANSITDNLAKNNQQVSNILNNADAITNQLSKAPLEQTLRELNGTMAQLQGIMAKVNNNEGSLGMIVNDKELYKNLSQAMKTLDALMADLNAHPSRYINVTIFGRKNKDK
jgi:phospholipid/cholesterol/gamma-HCH transport system substrate-binding protein